MAALSVTSLVGSTGVTNALAAAAAGGDSFANSPTTWLEIANANGSVSRVVTFVTTAVVDGQAVADKPVTILLSSRQNIGPFPQDAYGNTVSFTYDDETDLTVGAFEL